MDEAGARSDRRLSERIDAGDVRALEELYDAYAGAVYAQALAVLHSAADAEDVLQDVFLKLIRRRGAPIQDLKAYLCTAARHEAYSSLRKRQREQAGSDWLDAEPAPLSSLQASEQREAVREAMESLPAKQREVVVLKVYEQLTFEEIGHRVAASVNTVASRYRYALKKLRALLGDAANG
jgi:RNA polymerase sigma-70 factor (ECF subfamily)